MISIVEATMREHPGATLRRIFLDVGKGSTIESTLLREAFAIITSGGPFDGVELVINDIPITGRCRLCDRSFAYHEVALGCPSCGSLDIVIDTGMELNITELEIDD
jgi:hydrogenase nickel incorporation protein HypA/HybF